MSSGGTTGGATSNGGATVASGGTLLNSGGAPSQSGGAGATASGGTPSGTGGAASGGAEGSGGAGGGMQTELEPFSFFVTSLEGLQRLANDQNGFGGDLRYGETDGLAGADKICTELAEGSMPGAAAKQWRAFLSVSDGPVHAIDRVGDGPWYDRLGRVIAQNKDDLLNTRPLGADPAIINDLPNEYGVPNHRPNPSEPPVDNHHVLTGSNTDGRLYGQSSTCEDWTSTSQSAGRPRVGFSWPAGGRQHWISGQDEGGCGAGVNLEETGGSNPANPIVGSGGGYGAIYCFALSP